jgi:hypothetical protein
MLDGIFLQEFFADGSMYQIASGLICAATPKMAPLGLTKSVS